MIAAAQIAGPLEQALRWWLHELAACVPLPVRAAASRRLQTLVVLYGPDRVILRIGRSSRAVEIGAIDLEAADKASVGALLARVNGRINLRRALVVLKLPKNQLLRRRIALPLAAAENLREVIGYELDRLTPLRAEDVYYDYKLVERDQEGKRVLVDIVVAPRTIADHAIGALQGWGLTPDRLSADNGTAGDETINLLAGATSVGQRAHLLARITLLLGLLAAGLAAGAIFLEFHRQHAILATYEQKVAQQRAEGLEADAIKKQLVDLVDSGRYVQQRRQGHIRVVALLNALTQRIPDNIWLSQFRLQGNELVLSGHAPSASVLIGLLEESPVLNEVRFTSPVTPDPKVGLERFNLSASLWQDGGS